MFILFQILHAVSYHVCSPETAGIKAEKDWKEIIQQKMHTVSLEVKVIMVMFLSVHSTVFHTNRQKNDRLERLNLNLGLQDTANIS